MAAFSLPNRWKILRNPVVLVGRGRFLEEGVECGETDQLVVPAPMPSKLVKTMRVRDETMATSRSSRASPVSKHPTPKTERVKIIKQTAKQDTLEQLKLHPTLSIRNHSTRNSGVYPQSF